MTDSIENLYIIRVREENDIMRVNRLGELEQILSSDERAKLEHVIEPIAAAIAFIYDAKLAESLEGMGYELLPQERMKMIEDVRNRTP